MEATASYNRTSRGNRERLGKALALVFLIASAIISLFPLYWMFNTALTPSSATIKMPPTLIPVPLTLDNFERIFVVAPKMWRWMFNSIFIAVVSTAVHVVIDTMAGYAFAKRQFPGSTVLFAVVIASLMIPAQVTLVPQFLLITRLGLTDSYPGIILPGLADVLGIFLMKQFIQTLPTELEDAARVDGASEWQIFTNVIVPLSAPAIGVLAILSFTRYWNSFIWPLVVARSADLYTLQVGLSFVHTSEFKTEYGLMMAGAVIASLPVFAVFFAFQRYFMQGLRLGAVKG